jgi:hypothetical protein
VPAVTLVPALPPEPLLSPELPRLTEPEPLPEPELDALAPVPPLPAVVALGVVAVSSATSEAWSWASAAWAAKRLACSAVGSMVASDCPADTWSPTFTLMPVTVPLAGKAAVTWSTRWAVPVRVSTWLTGPRLTVAVR